jgi:D-glycero-D-manno-heptose 1,7-bisphosphate phosphatase
MSTVNGATRPSSPALFLDRDGVLNENRQDYVKSWREFLWVPGSLDGLAAIACLRVPIIIVTNQSMIGRGLATTDELEHIHARMLDQIVGHGGRVDAIFHCPHVPDLRCGCRKPEPGLLFKAAQAWHIDLQSSVMVGDTVTDLRAAMAAGTRYIHVRTGLGERDLSAIQAIDSEAPVVANLASAVPFCVSLLHASALVTGELNQDKSPTMPRSRATSSERPQDILRSERA